MIDPEPSYLTSLLLRLRQFRGEAFETTECFNGLRVEAADVIERLRKELDENKRVTDFAACSIAAGADWMSRAQTTMEIARGLYDAILPFVKIVATTSGRIPTERLSFADWHALATAWNAATPILAEQPKPKATQEALL